MFHTVRLLVLIGLLLFPSTDDMQPTAACNDVGCTVYVIVPVGELNCS